VGDEAVHLDAAGLRGDTHRVATAAWRRITPTAWVGGAALAYALAERVLLDWRPTELVWTLSAVLPVYALGLFVTVRRPDHLQARSLMLLGSSMCVGVAFESLLGQVYSSRAPGPEFWTINLAYGLTSAVTVVASARLLALFPDGDAERGWIGATVRSLWLFLAVPAVQLLTSADVPVDPYLPVRPQLDSPFSVPWLHALDPGVSFLWTSSLPVVVGVGVLLARYRIATEERRALMRWLVYSMALAAAMFAGAIGVNAVGAGPDWLADGLLSAVTILATWMMVAAIVLAIVRQGLFDVDVVARRSSAFVLLWLGIAAVYVAVAAVPGLALGGRIPVQAAVLVTILVAVAFQPLRRRLEALADRLVFGPRTSRYELVREFGASLEHSLDLDLLLPRLADTLRVGLGAPWVRVSLLDAGDSAGSETLEVLSGVGVGTPALMHEMRRDRELTGRIECGEKEGGFDTSDHDLVATLAAQATTAIANVRLTAQLSRQLDELVRSRARLVSAQDRERRRIERDIHDGAQQEVVAMITKLRLARNRVARGESPAALLSELQVDARQMLNDLRELAQGIHPSVLSDKGLVAALETRASRFAVSVSVDADDRLRDERVPRDAEAAAYFVVCEALTNVAKHADATRAHVALRWSGSCLHIDVVDDGVGLGSRNGVGTGLTSMRDRVGAVGGRISIGRAADGPGTRVSAELPLKSFPPPSRPEERSRA
jgi:signal transduction histidine kinase